MSTLVARLTAAAHADPRGFPDAALVSFTDAAGNLWHGAEVPIGSGNFLAFALVTPGAALTASLSAADAARVVAVGKLATNHTRLSALAARAGLYAKDPVANAGSQLSTQEIHEMLARLYLSDGNLP